MRVSVIIPCYRSRDSLPPLIGRLLEVLPTVAMDFEVIMVVDGSPDDTFAVAHALELDNPDHLRSVLLRRNYGQHNAILAGLSRARFEITVTMDDDLQHRPEELPKLLKPLQDPLVDLVYGVPRDEEHGLFRNAASRAVKTGLAVAGVPSAREVSALRAFRTELREGFAHVADQFVSLDVLLSWTTRSVERVIVTMDERPIGRSGYNLAKLLRHTLNMVTGYGTLPLRLVAWLGLTVALGGFVVLVVILALYWTGRTTVPGFTTLASLLALLSGSTMLSIGILGEYLGRLHFRSMQRPTYLVRVDSRDGGPLAGLPGTTLPRVPTRIQAAEVADAVHLRMVNDARGSAASSQTGRNAR